MKDIKPREWSRVILSLWLFGFLLPSSSPSAQEQFDLDTCRKSDSEEFCTCMQTLEASFTSEEQKAMKSNLVNKNGAMNLGKAMAITGECFLIKSPAPEVNDQNRPQPNTLALGIRAFEGSCANGNGGKIGKFVGDIGATNICHCTAQKTASQIPEQTLQEILDLKIPDFISGLFIRNMGKCAQAEIAKIPG